MKKVKIYTGDFCGYCTMAKRLLQSRGIEFEEINVSHQDELRIWLIQTTGQRTVPQIFIGDQSVGGYTDISALDRQGLLLKMVHAED
jgi:glutaredoxin 3